MLTLDVARRLLDAVLVEAERRGAAGVSGDTGDTDAACVFAGITAAGLQHGAGS